MHLYTHIELVYNFLEKTRFHENTENMHWKDSLPVVSLISDVSCWQPCGTENFVLSGPRKPGPLVVHV